MANPAFRTFSSAAPPGRADWQAALAAAVVDPRELCRRVGVDPRWADDAEEFPTLVPPGWLERIRPGDPKDPLLAQVLPQGAEYTPVPGYCRDPLCEAGAVVAPGLLSKYPGRSLIVATRRCGVHCRYCFRRHFAFSTPADTAVDWQPALERIAAQKTVGEVILSGGDPLTLTDRRLETLLDRLEAIPHLRRLRIHSRMPVAIPQRVTDGLLELLRGLRLPVIMVVQANHPAEIDAAVAAALGRLVDAGIPVLNQSVLLRGVNDDADVLAELCQGLVDLRTIPYYLHQLDPVAGAAHFAVPPAEGKRLIAALRARLPGYAVPRYVCEPPGGVSKEILA